MTVTPSLSVNGHAEPGPPAGFTHVHVLEEPVHWSNGPVEGHINRLKFIKRMMFGRANFDLLRKRVLYRCPGSAP